MTEQANYDYGDDAKPRLAEGVFQRLNDLAREQASAQAEIARLEAEMEKAHARLRKVSEEDIPALMDEIGLEDFTTTDGFSISVEEKVRCGISKERQPRAYAWLTENKHGKMIKRELSLPFAKGEEERVQQVTALLREAGVVDFELKSTVHAQTLLAWVKEQLREGKEFPQDLFGVIRQRVAKIDRK